MTLDEFMREFEDVVKDKNPYFLRDLVGIRVCRYFGDYFQWCPITYVAWAKNPKKEEFLTARNYLVAASKIGLPDYYANAIARAADHGEDHDSALRAQLLKILEEHCDAG